MSRRRPEDEPQAYARGAAHAEALALAAERGEPLPPAVLPEGWAARIAWTRGLWTARWAREDGHPYRTPSPVPTPPLTVPWTPRRA